MPLNCLLPPDFLLPAWSRGQLKAFRKIVLRSYHRTSRERPQISQHLGHEKHRNGARTSRKDSETTDDNVDTGRCVASCQSERSHRSRGPTALHPRFSRSADVQVSTLRSLPRPQARQSSSFSHPMLSSGMCIRRGYTQSSGTTGPLWGKQSVAKTQDVREQKDRPVQIRRTDSPRRRERKKWRAWDERKLVGLGKKPEQQAYSEPFITGNTQVNETKDKGDKDVLHAGTPADPVIDGLDTSKEQDYPIRTLRELAVDQSRIHSSLPIGETTQVNEARSLEVEDSSQPDALVGPQEQGHANQASRDRAASRVETATERDINRALLAQLFPEQQVPTATTKISREVPELPYQNVQNPPDGWVRSSEVARKVYMTHEIQELYDGGKSQTVLILSSTMKGLDEQDFRAILPRGKHIEEWSAEGGFVRVIPQRNAYSLERSGTYYIVFRNERSAWGYKKLVEEALHHASAHTPTDLFSPIPPAPGMLENGVDLHTIIENFALLPTKSSLKMQVVKPQYHSELSYLLSVGNYFPIVNRQEDPASSTAPLPRVLLRISGSRAADFSIDLAIKRDGFRRGARWNPLSVESLRALILSGRENGLWRASDSDESMEVHAESLMHNRFLASFTSRMEAKRFAMSWNAKRVTTSSHLTPVLVYAELL